MKYEGPLNIENATHTVGKQFTMNEGDHERKKMETKKETIEMMKAKQDRDMFDDKNDEGYKSRTKSFMNMN